MENQIEPNHEAYKANLDKKAEYQILETRKWTMFLSITGFVLLGLAFIFVLLFSAGIGQIYAPSAGMSIVAIIIMVIVYFFPAYFLYKFSIISKKALGENGLYDLSDALEYMKKYFQYNGIVLIIFLSLYTLGIMAAILFGVLFKS